MQHHAYYIEGSPAQFDEYKAVLKPLWAKKFERFGVEDARALIDLASLKGAEQCFFVALSSITTEAQQALLKLLEEPQEGTMFVFLLPHGVLLPTVRSRMMEYPNKIARAKLRVLKKDIAALIKEDDKEKVREFLDALEHELHKKIADPKARAALQDIAMVRDYLRDRSPSLKMLLEHLAVSLPKM